MLAQIVAEIHAPDFAGGDVGAEELVAGGDDDDDFFWFVHRRVDDDIAITGSSSPTPSGYCNIAIHASTNVYWNFFLGMVLQFYLYDGGLPSFGH